MAYRARFDEARQFGIELEGFGLWRTEVVEVLAEKKISAYSGDYFDKKQDSWLVSQDGTIKPTYPLEIVSPILSGKKSFSEIKKVCNALNELGIKSDESCGLHVHWGVGDYTGRSMVNLLRLYGKYEKILDLLFPIERRENANQFGRSLIKNGDMNWLYRLQWPYYFHAYQIAQEFEATQPTQNITSYPTARHHKVNICAYNKYRTVEFRQHEGTFDFEKIKNWIIFSQQLVERAKDTLVMEGVATWDSLLKTLALTEPQLNESMDSPDKKLLREREISTEKFTEKTEKKRRKKMLLSWDREFDLPDEDEIVVFYGPEDDDDDEDSDEGWDGADFDFDDDDDEDNFDEDEDEDDDGYGDDALSDVPVELAQIFAIVCYLI